MTTCRLFLVDLNNKKTEVVDSTLLSGNTVKVTDANKIQFTTKDKKVKLARGHRFAEYLGWFCGMHITKEKPCQK